MRLGVFQCAGGGWNQDQRLAHLDQALSDKTLDLILCPELFASGYNVGQQLAEYAEPSGGGFSARVSEIAVKYAVAIVYGYPERDDNRLYNSAVCIGSRGQVVANQRKLSLPPGRESDFFTCGDKLTLFDVQGIRCCLLICYDAEHPESVRAAAEAGVQLILVPTALADIWPTVALQMMPTRAFENGVWLAYANQAGLENGLAYLGGSCIIAPDGRDAARAGTGQQVIRADIDLDSVTRAQIRLPYLDSVRQLRPLLKNSIDQT